MVINENNSQISSFVKGMNSDSAYDQIGNDQYVYAKNVRITKNLLIGGASDYSSLHEGIITPVFDGVEPLNAQLLLYTSNERILNICTVDKLGALITTNGTDMFVYKFIIDEVDNNVEEFRLIWRADNIWDEAPELVSAVLYKELLNVIKLYIATGEQPIISFRIDDDSVDKLMNNNVPVDKDSLINNRILPSHRVFIEDKISGRLLTSQVLYTYRCYNKYGNTTLLAPLTNKIQVIDSSRSKEIGNAENTETSIGFTLSIDLSDLTDYERIQVFRLLYIKPNTDADVSLIYDDNIKLSNNKFILNDVGIEPLQLLTMEEFSAMSGLILVPLTIEQNLEYMFCANVKDDTIIKGIHIDAETPVTVLTKVILSTKLDGQIPDPGHTKYSSTDYIDGNYSVQDYMEDHGINKDLAESTYENIFTSSLLRSLRRGETYKYAIVYYDKYGRRTDVLNLGDVTVPEYKNNTPFTIENGKLIANPIGVKINIPIPNETDDFKLSDVRGCQIVRRNSSDVYLKALLLVALARPIRQGLLETLMQDYTVDDGEFTYSPYYPTGLLLTNEVIINPIYYIYLYDDGMPLSLPNELLRAKTDTNKLYLIFSSEIDFRRDDVLARLSSSGIRLKEQCIISGIRKKYKNQDPLLIDGLFTTTDLNIFIERSTIEKLRVDKKQSYSWVFNFYEKKNNGTLNIEINSIKDVKIPNWEDGFSNILKNEDQMIVSSIMKYKSYTTSIDEYLYNNWVSFGKYDLPADNLSHPNMTVGSDGTNANTNDGREIVPNYGNYAYWLGEEEGNEDIWARQTRNGYIGPGGSCFLMTLKENGPGQFGDYIHTSICDITHISNSSNIESDEQVQYFGFGNYFPLEYSSTNGFGSVVVFDGDIYITPHEFTTMYKTYNFESVDTLQSTLITNYIPLESKVNTFFDYGMNLYNTNSSNLLYEPGSIEGVTTQERPAHQYNMIYSDNDSSNDIFTLISTDDNETNQFKQRAYYSELKTNGEFIDNFLIFKPTAFIDVDSKYGEITNLYTDRNSLFYWQDSAFGKFSVNERSLVNDQNSNTIMLGQAGILSRYDYISTKYGMRLHDFCARSTERGIYWVDINNKAIVGADGTLAINYGEQLGVLNIINDKITPDIPQVDYDLQNNELLCKCLGGELIVFNTKYNMATSIYTRDYDKIAYIKNHMYEFKVEDDTVDVKKDNYIEHDNNSTYDYLSPLMLSLVINPAASATKVFDSQLIVPIKRDKFLTDKHILNNTTLAFETDMVKKTCGDSMEPYTDREGNIIYNVPRYMNQPYGNRMRGKWMKVDIKNEDPSEYFTISHILTKYRQSYS